MGMTNESVSSQERNPFYGNTVTVMAGLWGPAPVALEKNLIQSLSQTHIKPSRFWILDGMDSPLFSTVGRHDMSLELYLH